MAGAPRGVWWAGPRRWPPPRPGASAALDGAAGTLRTDAAHWGVRWAGGGWRARRGRGRGAETSRSRGVAKGRRRRGSARLRARAARASLHRLRSGFGFALASAAASGPQQGSRRVAARHRGARDHARRHFAPPGPPSTARTGLGFVLGGGIGVRHICMRDGWFRWLLCQWSVAQCVARIRGDVTRRVGAGGGLLQLRSTACTYVFCMIVHAY